ncbi:hypothetical protein BV25DRAFT_1784395, partial [Artomyces pyxidatus]
PAWVEEARSFFLATMDGKEWHDCVENWTRFEKMQGYPDRKDRTQWVKTAARPEQFSDWSKRHRNYANVPTIADPDEYAQSWRDWWVSLQPTWRTEGAVAWPLLRDIGKEKDWTDLRKGGMNGFLCILIVLAWW